MLVAGLLFFDAGPLAARLAQSATQLITARAGMGVGGALLMTTTLAVVVQIFDDTERVKTIGLWSTVNSLRFAAGPLIGGVMLDHFWWGAIFLINIPVAAIGLVAVVALVPESKNPQGDRRGLLGALPSPAGRRGGGAGGRSAGRDAAPAGGRGRLSRGGGIASEVSGLVCSGLLGPVQARSGNRGGCAMVSAADRAKGPARTSVWLDGKVNRGAVGSRRSTQPDGLDREKIIEATVRLLDAEGAAKFSMRRLAAELNVTAMSVYWYVDTKDDLLELALDAVFGKFQVPEVGTEGDWREQLRELATGYRTLLVRHPWASALIGTFLNIGPNSMAFSLAVQQVMRNTGLPPHGQMGGLAAVFQFVYGFGTVEGHFIERCATAGMSQDECFRQAMGTISEQPAFREKFDSASELMEARGGDTVEEMRERDFGYALDLLVAGIEAMVARA
jgi:AcrR family transcriptional regulator